MTREHRDSSVNNANVSEPRLPDFLVQVWVLSCFSDSYAVEERRGSLHLLYGK